MDVQKQNRRCLEPIQEESEQEDEIERSETGEGEEEDFPIKVDVQTKEVVTEEESEEDEDDAPPLRVLRPRRLSRSLLRESFLQMQSTSNHQEEMENFSASDQSTHAGDLSGEATPPGQTRLGNEKRFSSGELKIKVSKIKWQKHTTPKPSVHKTNKKRDHKTSLVEEAFPRWLVDLMVNIEEATTHQLVVE